MFLLNLVGNAIKFTDAGEVSITAGPRNGHFAVSVTDTGPGIPLDQQDRIFDQFTRSTVPLPRPRAARASVSPSPSRSSRCTAGASGWSRRRAKDRRSRWSFPRAPNSESPAYDEADCLTASKRIAKRQADVVSLYSITSSARASNVGAISKPNAFAVLRLTAKSNFAGCSTG